MKVVLGLFVVLPGILPRRIAGNQETRSVTENQTEYDCMQRSCAVSLKAK
jgi:hypothetical protein